MFKLELFINFLLIQFSLYFTIFLSLFLIDLLLLKFTIFGSDISLDNSFISNFCLLSILFVEIDIPVLFDKVFFKYCLVCKQLSLLVLYIILLIIVLFLVYKFLLILIICFNLFVLIVLSK